MNAKSIAKNIFVWIRHQMQYPTYFKAIKEMRSGGAYTKLTNNQKKEIQQFWKKNYGRKINLKWHEYFYYVNKEFSPRYIPTYIYYTQIAPKLNDSRIAVVYSDKNMIDRLLGEHIKYPKTYIKNMNGNYYINNELVDKETAINACLNINDGVIKHNLDTSKGMSIIRFSCKNGAVTGKNTPSSIRELFDSYQKNFIVQAAIQQCDEMSELNPTSLNTVRIMTYWSEKGIVPLYAVVRIGRSGSVVDNASAGGMYCGVNLGDGSLKKEAYTLSPFSALTHTDNGTELNKFKIPEFETIKKKAVELHQYLPYVRFVGWDMSINKNHEIELVEANANCPGLFQAATGPAFGDYTEEILRLCSK